MFQLELGQVVILIVNVTLTAILGALIAKVKRRFEEMKSRQVEEAERQKSLIDGNLAILLSYIFEAYVEHVLHGCPMSYAKATIVEDICLAYEKNGGNGVAKKMIARLREQTEIIIVGGDPDEYPHGHRGVDPID